MADSREPSKATYAFLESLGDSQLMSRDSGVSAPEGPIRHAIDPSGHRILMIPVNDEQFDQFVDDRAGTSVSLRRELYAEDGSINPFLVFRCEPALLRDTFAAFVDDVLEGFERPEAEAKDAGVTARFVLDRWRRLFARRGSGLLSDKIIVGLAAELRVLLSVLAERGPDALESWTGPERADRDFTFEGVEIEVKGTQRKTGLEIEINGLGQLAPPDDGALYLAASRVQFSPTGVVTIPALVDSVLEAGVDRELLAEKLELVGYYHSRSDEYAGKKMEFLEDRFFHVTENFPRIDPGVISTVPQADRIRGLSYLLDLTAHETVPGALELQGVESFIGGVL
ncbi:PD-(D/E)XK motif protein [Dietzia maris]|uniref:PD-(D/E)XK motif protein n=1 Tax=Dietzia maris TaxID=37915 RepID=UPI0030F7B67B